MILPHWLRVLAVGLLLLNQKAKCHCSIILSHDEYSRQLWDAVSTTEAYDLTTSLVECECCASLNGQDSAVRAVGNLTVVDWTMWHVPDAQILPPRPPRCPLPWGMSTQINLFFLDYIIARLHWLGEGYSFRQACVKGYHLATSYHLPSACNRPYHHAFEHNTQLPASNKGVCFLNKHNNFPATARAEQTFQWDHGTMVVLHVQDCAHDSPLVLSKTLSIPPYNSPLIKTHECYLWGHHPEASQLVLQFTGFHGWDQNVIRNHFQAAITNHITCYYRPLTIFDHQSSTIPLPFKNNINRY